LGVGPPLVLQLSFNERPNLDGEQSSSEIVRRFDELGTTESELPYMDPICEGYELVPYPETATIGDLIAEERFTEAISMVSSVLDREPGNSELVLERAKLLEKIGKDTDAICECSCLLVIGNAIAVEAKSLRVGLWHKLGRELQADEDVRPAGGTRGVKLARQIMHVPQIRPRWDGLW
jgi:hypothetical protein